MPLRDNAVDAAVSCHVFYHIPEKKQAQAFEEIARVTKGGHDAFVVYKWNYSPIQNRLIKLAKLCGTERPLDVQPSQGETPELYFHAFDSCWFEGQRWSFNYEFLSYRIIDNGFMKRFVGDGLVSKAFLKGAWILQRLFPKWCGRFGIYPLIHIKPKS